MRTNSTPEVRFWLKVDKNGPNGCWLWTAALDRDGYGVFDIDRKQVRASRFAYKVLVNPIPEGLTIDHLCRIRACVNPRHLEPVSNRENGLRGNTLQAENARKTHCPKGHPYDLFNTGTQSRRSGGRYCRVCKKERARLQEVRLRQIIYKARYRTKHTTHWSATT